MNTVIARAKLIDIVTAARVAHQTELLKARANWQKAILKEVGAVVQRAESFDPETGRFSKGKRIFDRDMVVLDAPPKDMTKEYDRVLRMLKLDVRDEIELDEREYRQFVENDWQWRQAWATSNSKYL